MDNQIINQQEALKILESGEKISSYKIVFNQNQVEALDAILLGKNGFIVPEELIYYDDDAIDFSDDPDVTDEDLASGKIRWTVRAKIPLKQEVADWVREQNIDLSELAARLIHDFYDLQKELPSIND